MKTLTKLFGLIFVFLMLSSVSMNAQYYADPIGDGGQPLLEIWIYGAALPGGGSLEAGDEIAVYSGATLVGRLTLTVTPSASTLWSSHLIAYSKNTSGAQLYTPDDPFILKCWDGTTEYVAYGWGDGEPIDFHNEWYAPTSDNAATATTLGAYFPALGGYSYSYVDATFATGGIPLEAEVRIDIDESDGTTNIATASVTSGGYTATYDAPSETYTLLLFAGNSGDTDDYTYTVTISNTGDQTETFDIVVNGNTPAGWDEHVLMNAYGNLDGFVRGYDDPTDPIGPVENATVSVTIDGMVYSDNTDASGAYLIEDIPDGVWTFTASYPDHISQEFTPAAITHGGTTNATTVDLDYKVGTIEGEIFDATTISLITDASLAVKLYELDDTYIKDGTITDGSYTLSYYGGTYKVVVSCDNYEDYTVAEQTLYPDYTETMNFNLLPTANLTPYFNPVITGNPNQMWSIHIEMAKFGNNFLLPYDELVIFDTDQVGLVDEPGLRVGTLRLTTTGVWQNSGSNVMKAFGQFSNGTTGFVEGNDIEIWAYDISHGAVYETPIDWWLNTGVGTYSGTTFPDPSANHISYLNIYWETVPGQLSGTVTDVAGANPPIEGVTVQALNTYTQDVINSDVTDANGEYSMPLDEGTYDIRFTNQNWETIVKDDVVIVQSETTVLDTTLTELIPVTVHYTLGAVWVPGFYFIGRCLEQDPVEDDMLTLLDNPIGSWTPFSQGFYTSWVENDDGVRLENTGTPHASNTWVPDPYDWELLEGYQVFRSAYYHFDMTGYLVKPNENPITFASADIYYIPYFPYDVTNPDDAMTAFAGIFDELDWVMDGEGNRLHHDGGGWVDNIGILSPSEGYKIKMNEAATLTYPLSAGKSAGSRSPMMDPVHFVYTGGNAADWTYTIYIDTDEFEIGDEIAAFSNGVMVGSMVIDSEDPWENDLNTFNIAVNGGYEVNTPIEFMAWDASENVDYYVAFEMVEINSACYAGENFPAGLDHFSYVNIYRGTVRVDENQVNNNVRIYPNPVNSTLNIESVSIINDIHVYNIYGALISRTDVNAKQQQIDVSNFATGTYLIQLHTNTGIITKRIIIQ